MSDNRPETVTVQCVGCGQTVEAEIEQNGHYYVSEHQDENEECCGVGLRVFPHEIRPRNV